MSRAAEILIVLPSIHDVLAVEDRACGAGLWVDVLPKPTAIATDCGMVLGCLEADLDALLGAVRAAGVDAPEIHRVTANGYRRLHRREVSKSRFIW